MIDNGSTKGIQTTIETGEQNETDVIVKSGLTEGDRIILQGRQRPQQGGWSK